MDRHMLKTLFSEGHGVCIFLFCWVCFEHHEEELRESHENIKGSEGSNGRRNDPGTASWSSELQSSASVRTGVRSSFLTAKTEN